MPLKVLHILDHYLPLFSGYTFRSSYILDSQKQALGIEPVVVTSAKQGISPSPMETFDGVRVYRVGAVAPWTQKAPVMREWAQMKALEKRILEVAEKEKPDVLHAHSPVLNAWPAIWAGRKLGIPAVYEIRAFWEDAAVEHGSTTEGSLRYRATRTFETSACKKADAVVTICQGLRKGLLERGIPQSKLFVLPNGVDVGKFPPPELDRKLQAELGLEGKQVLGFIGSLYRYEGLVHLLAAVALMLPKHPDLRCLIVGGGYDNEEAELKQKAESLGISHAVIVQGKVPHERVNSFYSLIDILVYPRIRSRLLELVTPLKPLEAMSMRKPVIGSDVGGIKELIEEGRNGLLFKADDPGDLARVADGLLSDPQRMRDLGLRASEYVASERSWRKLIEAHRQTYRSLGLKV
ncbi:MAG: glycosyltransferase, exosortase A system-associated [Fibrobacteres bacterium]|nr:glycosyltransferase, exosortase A system-associated [Fibrobacterota bacterium]